MKKKISTILKYAFFLSLGFALLYFSFRNTNPAEMIGQLREANYFWIGVSVFVGIFSYYSRAARWLIMLEPLGYKPKLTNSLYSVFFGYFANIAAPRIGELARCSAINQTEKIPLNALIGTVLLERVLDVIILLALILISFLMNVQLFGDFFLNSLQQRFRGGENESPFSVLIFALIATVLIGMILYFFRKKIMNNSFAEKAKTFLRGVFDGFSSIGKMKKKWLFVFHTLFIWITYILMTYIGFFALKETAHLSFSDGIFITVAGGVGMAIPANGGIGTYHAAIMFGLVALGIAQSHGLAFATLMHASQTLFILFTGSVSFVLLYFEKNRKIKENDYA